MAKADIALSVTTIGDRLYHLVINDTYYIKINSIQFEQIAELLNINIEDRPKIKKKIKYFTDKEIDNICRKFESICKKCPLYVNEDVCKNHLEEYQEEEIEVDYAIINERLNK